MNRRNVILGIVIVGVLVAISIWRSVDRPRFTMVGTSGEVSVVPPMGASDRTEDSYAMQKVAGAPVTNIAYNEIAPPSPPTNGAGISSVDKRLIIKTGEFSVVVKHVSDAANAIGAFVEEKKGIVVSSQTYNLDTNPTAVVMVRVPVDRFAEVVAHIKGVGEVKSESINGQDVTEEYVDLNAQLKNLKATEAQFLEIMKKANQIQDILAVERELMNVRSSIESLEGRMKYLSESADYSTITVYLSSDSASLPIVDNSDQWKFVGEIKDAIRSLVEFGKEFVSLIVWIAVFIPVWGICALIVWFIVRKIKHKNTTV